MEKTICFTCNKKFIKEYSNQIYCCGECREKQRQAKHKKYMIEYGELRNKDRIVVNKNRYNINTCEKEIKPLIKVLIINRELQKKLKQI